MLRRIGPLSCALAFAVVGPLALLGCRASADRTAPHGSAPSATASQVAAPASAASSDEVPPAGLPMPPEDLNAGCAFRKNSGRVASCERSPEGGNLGDWVPTKDELTQVMTLAEGACYCASGLATRVAACVRMQRTTTVTVKVGLDTDATDCTITVRAGEWGSRRFVVVDAANRDRATFYSTQHVVEQTKRGISLYFRGFNGVPGESDPTKPGDGVSETMASEWATLPQPWKTFFQPP